MKRKFITFLAWFFFIGMNLIPQMLLSYMFSDHQPTLETDITLRTICFIVTGLLSADAFKLINDLNDHE